MISRLQESQLRRLYTVMDAFVMGKNAVGVVVHEFDQAFEDEALLADGR